MNTNVNSKNLVKATPKGNAYKMWGKTNGETMYLIQYVDGRELWTNSLKIISEQIDQKIKPTQLKLF